MSHDPPSLTVEQWEVVCGAEDDEWGIRRVGEGTGMSVAQMVWKHDAHHIVNLHNTALRGSTAPPEERTPEEDEPRLNCQGAAPLLTKCNTFPSRMEPPLVGCAPVPVSEASGIMVAEARTPEEDK